MKYNKTEFIAWDGEGIKVAEPLWKIDIGGLPHWTNNIEPKQPRIWFNELEYAVEAQPYILLANSKGDSIVSDDPENGLGTIECFELMLNAKKKYPNSIFVGFGFNYDINQILRHLHEDRLWDLHDKNQTYWRSYFIKWLPGKSLIVSHRRTKRSFIIYDVFGFFQSSFLEACKKYLGNDPRLEQIEQGKAARETFEYSELDTFIKPYNELELQLLVEMMNVLREELHSVGIYPSRWHGPGAIADVVLKQWSIPISRSIPKEVLDASQYAYAGGRFEHYWLGRYGGPVYEYDIHSAYPAGATHLPNLSEGTWENVKRFEPDSFGVWSINYRSKQQRQGIRPEPLFCRSENGLISYPCKVEGWYWTPEACLCPDSVIEGWVFRPFTDERPFRFIENIYEERRLFKLSQNSAERALKLILNSIYGKLAQTVGMGKDIYGQPVPPRWHQLEYAGYITSYTRAKIYNAILLNPDAIIAVETDAVFSSRPLDLPLTENLGDWELKEYDGITYLQSGFYYADKSDGSVVCKYRGMDRDRETKQPVGLPYRKVLDHLRFCGGTSHGPTPPLRSHTTRFIGLGLGLRTLATWRAWEKSPKTVSLDQRNRESKRIHMSDVCRECFNGYSMFDRPHQMIIGGHYGHSYPTPIPWRPNPNDIPIDIIDWAEFCDTAYKFQSQL